MSRIAIFDLDNTLNSTVHRNYLIPKDPTVNENWLPWHTAFTNEVPNLPLLNTMERLSLDRWKIIVCSNRCESLIGRTADWFKEHARLASIDHYFLRNPNDHTPPSEWKSKTLDTLLTLSNAAITLVFDDDLKALESIQYKNGVVTIPTYFNG